MLQVINRFTLREKLRCELSEVWTCFLLLTTLEYKLRSVLTCTLQLFLQHSRQRCVVRKKFPVWQRLYLYWMCWTGSKKKWRNCKPTYLHTDLYFPQILRARRNGMNGKNEEGLTRGSWRSTSFPGPFLVIPLEGRRKRALETKFPVVSVFSLNKLDEERDWSQTS